MHSTCTSGTPDATTRRRPHLGLDIAGDADATYAPLLQRASPRHVAEKAGRGLPLSLPLRPSIQLAAASQTSAQGQSVTHRMSAATASPHSTPAIPRGRSTWRRLQSRSSSRVGGQVVPEDFEDQRLDRNAVLECERRLRLCADPRFQILGFDVDEEFQRIVLYKNHCVSRSCLLHLALVRSCRAQDATLVRSVLERKANVYFKGRYINPLGTETEFEAIHMAANLGCIPVLEVLLEFAVQAQTTALAADLEDWGPEDVKDLEAEYVSTWAHIIPGEPHYQPIHDAAFGRQKDAMLWLLEKGGDAGAPNLYGLTALHLIALNGMNDENPGVIEGVLRRLLDDGQNVAPLVSKVLTNHHLAHYHGRTPLELAALPGSQFPKDCMYLLAPSHWDADTEPRFFEDLLLLARSNTTHAADALARKICEKASQSTSAGSALRRRVRQEAQKWIWHPCESSPGRERYLECQRNEVGCGSSTLACLFFMVPNAAADMVDILTAKPHVQDPAKHPIPTRASLKAPHPILLGRGCQPMLCSYQKDAKRHGDLIRPEWKFNAEKTEWDQPELTWHKELVPERNEIHLGRKDNIFSVSMKVVLWPNILDLDVCRALVCTAPADDAIFARLPVQAIVYWFWNNLGFRAFVMGFFFHSVELAALVRWGVGDGGHSSRSHPFCWALLVAGNIREGLNMLWCFKEYCSRWREHKRSDAANSVLQYLWHPSRFVPENMVDLTSVALRMWLLLDEQHMGSEEMTDVGQALISANVMVGVFRLIYMMRLLDGMGKGILAILETFFSGTIQQMLFICLMVFANFFLGYVVLARRQDFSQVFLQLYRGFFFGDGEALDALGLGESSESYCQIHIYAWFTINMNRLLALLGTLFFSVIILNLIIAIYGNEYEKIKRITGLLFLKQRLRLSCNSVLMYRKLLGPTPVWLSFCMLPANVAASIVLLHDPWLPDCVHQRLSVYHRLVASAGLMAVGQSILQMVVLEGSDMGKSAGVHLHCHGQSGEPRFLWICHRSDFSTHIYDPKDVTKEDMKQLADEVSRKLACLDKSMDRTERRLYRMEQLLNEKMEVLFAKVERAMDRL